MSSSIAVKTAKIALAGQPNTGKSTVFNRLTGSKQHVGNWPGKTVEQKEGFFLFKGRQFNIVDLPGTYSLTANSVEERISRDFLIKEKPDAVIVMADASQLERTMYFIAEIMLLSVPVVVALNMMDVAEKKGLIIDTEKLEMESGLRIIPVVASRGEGIDTLIDEVCRLSASSEKGTVRDNLDIYPAVCRNIYDLVRGNDTGIYSAGWLAVKLAEDDSEAMEIAESIFDKETMDRVKKLLSGAGEGPLIAAGARFDWISRIVSASVSNTGNGQSGRKWAGFDRAATHPFFGGVIAFFVMIFAFAAAMAVAMPVMMLIRPATVFITGFIRNTLTVFWLGSMLADGLIPGISVALMMLSYITGVYLVFGFLEDVGYLPRMAYVFDRPMNRIGLHGKSFMPLIMSFGCNIAGVTGTRVIDSWQQRMITLVMASIVPCLALWAVVSFIGVIFFKSAMPYIILSLFAAMLLHLSLTSFVMRKFIVKGKTTGLIMELPPYHRPNWRTILSHVWVQVKAFLKRAVTLIAFLSVIVWALSFQKDGNMDNSVLAIIGKFFDPVTSLIGLDWRLFIALIASMIAKEASLSVIAVLYNVGGSALSITSFFFSHGGYEKAALAGTILDTVSPASALAFIFAFFFSIPCIGTVATIYSETKSLKWTAGSSLYYLLTSFTAAALAYRVGLLIF